MNIFERVFESSIASARNTLLMLCGVFAVILTSGALLFLFLFEFREIYQNTGSIIPERTDYLSENFDAQISSNGIAVGKKYKKGDLLVVFNEVQLRREIENISNEMLAREKEVEFYGYVINNSKNFAGRIELEETALKRKSAIAALEKLRNSLKSAVEMLEKRSIEAPYDCFIVSSAFEGYNDGIVPKGAVICKIISSDETFIKMPVQKSWYDRIDRGQECLIVLKQSRCRGIVEETRYEETDKIIQKYAYIKVGDNALNFPGMECTVRVVTEKTTVWKILLRTIGYFSK